MSDCVITGLSFRVRFLVEVPIKLLESDNRRSDVRLAVTGSACELGNWNPHRCLLLNAVSFSPLPAAVDLSTNEEASTQGGILSRHRLTNCMENLEFLDKSTDVSCKTNCVSCSQQGGRRRCSHCENTSLWTGELVLEPATTMPTELRIRFFSCLTHELLKEVAAAAGCASGGGQQLGYRGRLVQVLQWETSLEPRVVTLIFDDDGLCVLPLMKYGEIENDAIPTQRGWLTGQTAVHLRIHPNSDGREPFRWFKRCSSTLRIHSRHFDVRNKKSFTRMKSRRESATQHSLSCSSGTEDQDDDEWIASNEEDSWVSTNSHPSQSERAEFCMLNEELCVPRRLPSSGVRYSSGDYLSFHHLVLDLGTAAFDIAVEEEVESTSPLELSSNDSLPRTRPVGHATILPFHLHRDGSQGMRQVSIVNKRAEIVGTLSVDFLIITSLPGVLACDMSVSYGRHWAGRTLHVGHRGAGGSHKRKGDTKRVSHIRENTIQSMTTAALHGADYVEFDVLLSRDEVPVIYHDFYVSATCRKRDSRNLTNVVLPVQTLTAEELRTLKLWHAESAEDQLTQEELNDDSLDPEDLLPFPTLQQCFTRVPHRLGFNVELKFPSALREPARPVGNTSQGQDQLPPLNNHGGWGHECLNPCDMNRFVDRVVMDALRHGGQRHIIFSCFNPDICTLLTLKQCKYPVMFLTQGIQTHWPDFLDIRTRPTYMSALCCRNHGFLGVAPCAQELLADESLVNKLLALGLVIFVWGTEMDDSELRAKISAKQVHGIIYDRIHEADLCGVDSQFQSGRYNNLLLKSDIFDSKAFNLSEQS